MSLLTSESPTLLWQQVLRDAQQDCSVQLDVNVEQYLTSLLIRYTNQPSLTQQIFASNFLEAVGSQSSQRNASLQEVGDQCLLYTGLFPRFKQRILTIDYFITLGRSAYLSMSDTSLQIYRTLSYHFVQMMDILQSIRQDQLEPWEAHEQWRRTGSQRAYRMVELYQGRIIPLNRRR